MNRLILPLVMIAFGLLFAGVGVLTARGPQPYEDGVLTSGTVVEYERRVGIGRDNPDTFAPIIEYVALDGETHRFTSSSWSTNPADLGTVVEVSYRPSDPAGARNLSVSTWWGWAFVAVGVPALIAGVVFFFKMVARNRSEASSVPPMPPG